MSQFDGLLEIKKKKEPTEKNQRGSSPKKEKSAMPTPPPVVEQQADKPTGKSKRADFVQTSIYIKKETQISVKARLLTDSENRDFSDLVEELLTSWLAKKS